MYFDSIFEREHSTGLAKCGERFIAKLRAIDLPFRSVGHIERARYKKLVLVGDAGRESLEDRPTLLGFI